MPSDLALQVAGLLLARGETLAVAETSAGGLILSLLTDVPGASGWLCGGIVPYSNAAKTEVLRVPAEVAAQHGVVSAETALALARGARQAFGATWGIGETGITGPQAGRRSSKPPGLTYLALAGERRGHTIERAERVLLECPGDREAIKRAFAEEALRLLIAVLSA